MKHLLNTLLALQPNYIGVWANDCGLEPSIGAVE